MTGLRHALFLGWRHARHHAGRSATLAFCLGLVLWLPLGTHRIVNAFAAAMLERAQSTPQVVGARGSRFDLVLHALYFRGVLPTPVGYGELAQFGADRQAVIVPLLGGYTARGHPIVGTTLDYFTHRGLRVVDGERFALLGDCVLGANVARRLGLASGGRLMSDPQNVFDLAGSYPLNLLVRGVLAPARSPDDDAVFVDVKTAWIIGGIGHGHEALTAKTDPRLLTTSTGGAPAANSALRHFTEISAENLASFHFHGDPATFPVSGALIFPRDEKSATLLEGRLGTRSSLHIVRPASVVLEILGLVFEVKRFLELNFAIVGIVMLALFALIVGLAVRMRQREFETLHQLGCTRFFLTQLVVAEIALLTASAGAIAVVLVLATHRYGPVWLLHLVGS